MMDRHELAEYTLSELKKAGASDAECRVTDTVLTEIYYESGKISMVRTNYNTSLGIKAVKNMKKGTVSTNSTDIESVDACISNVMTALESATPDEAEGICEVPAKESFTQGVPEPDLEKMYDGLKLFIKQCSEKYPTISFDSITIEHRKVSSLYCNTNGTDITSVGGAYIFSPMYMAVEDGVSSSFNYSGAVFLDITKPFMSLALTEQKIKETVKQVKTVSVDGKFTGDIIFVPDCFGGIMSDAVGNFMSDRCLIDGTSIYKDKLGKKVAADSLTFWSAPKNPEIIDQSFMTGDGYLAENVKLIDNGVLNSFVLSRYGAKKTGLERCRATGGQYVIEAGNTPLCDMIKGVKRGLLVSRFSGGAPATNGDFSGVAKNSFLIENGEITDAVSETMITGNLASLLFDITEISQERVNDGDSILPWVKVKNIAISGK